MTEYQVNPSIAGATTLLRHKSKQGFCLNYYENLQVEAIYIWDYLGTMTELLFGIVRIGLLFQKHKIPDHASPSLRGSFITHKEA